MMAVGGLIVKLYKNWFDVVAIFWQQHRKSAQLQRKLINARGKKAQISFGQAACRKALVLEVCFSESTVQISTS